MGFKYFSSGSRPARGNPVPNNYKVVKVQPVGNYLVADLCYPDAINFEGRKILVFKDMTRDEFFMLNIIDPHFGESNSIVARFKPDREGWSNALKFASHVCE